MSLKLIKSKLCKYFLIDLHSEMPVNSRGYKYSENVFFR